MSSDIPVTEGEADFSPEGAGKPCKTWYKIYGTLTPDSTPLICLHGGPGVSHYYLLPIQALAARGIPVIFYDQIGCGSSTHLPELAGSSFWNVNLFIDELNNLTKHLSLTSYNILGQSWGGMLAACFAVLSPPGLRKLIIADSPASMPLWIAACSEQIAALPPDVQETIKRCEKEGTTETEEYEQAIQVFYDRHVCRVKPLPWEMAKSFEELKKDNTVYSTMNGPSEFTITGSLKNWSIVKELHKIKIPTLLINGKYDEAQDSVMQPFFKHIDKVKWVKFAESSHVPQLEETEAFNKEVERFLLG